MTDHPDNPAGRNDIAVLGTAEALASIRYAIERLSLAAKVMELATSAAEQAARRVRLEQPTPARVLETWQVANLLIDAAFRALHFQVLNASDSMKAFLPEYRD